MKVQKYVTRQREVTVLQYNGDNAEEIKSFMNGELIDWHNPSQITISANGKHFTISRLAYVVKQEDAFYVYYQNDIDTELEKMPDGYQPSYLVELEQTLNEHRDLQRLYEERITILQDMITNSQGTRFTLNPLEIELIDIKGKLMTLQRMITEKYNYFVSFARDFDRKKADMELNYDRILELAMKKGEKDANIKKFLNSVDMSMMESNIEMKVDFYTRLVNLKLS